MSDKPRSRGCGFLVLLLLVGGCGLFGLMAVSASGGHFDLPSLDFLRAGQDEEYSGYADFYPDDREPAPVEGPFEEFEPDTPAPDDTYAAARPLDYSAAEDLQTYWYYVAAGDFPAAWTLLSPTFQQNMHGGSYDSYYQGYQDMQLCDVLLDSTTLIEQQGYSAVVYGHVVYWVRADCTLAEFDFDFHMVYDDASGVWLIDRTTFREAPPRSVDTGGTRPPSVSDADVARVQQISEAASRGEISQEEAERELEDVAMQVGADGMEWLVRHVPIYDSEGDRWMLFDDYAHEMVEDYDTDPDSSSRFEEDPVGTATDLMFGDYDTEDISDWLGLDDY